MKVTSAISPAARRSAVGARGGTRAGAVHVAVLAVAVGLTLLAAGFGALYLLGTRATAVDASAFRADPVAADPVRFGTVPEFRFTDQHGQAFGSEELAGRPWVLAAIFTTCAGPCPKIVRGLQSIEARLAAADARIVLFSVDPEYDTPEVLTRFAERFGTGERWTYLTGPESEVHGLLAKDFLMGAQRDDGRPAGERVTHAVKLVAVGADGTIRGWYSGVEDEGLEALAERIEFLATEPASTPAEPSGATEAR